MEHFQVERLLSARFKRRGLLIGAGATAGLAIASQWPRRVVAQPKFLDYPFKLGIASGDPLPDSVVIWTRLAPDPLNGGGMRDQSFPVQWQVAEDEAMRRVVQRGNVVTTPDLAHSVHVEVGGLQPNRWYWYQFKAGSEVSPVGRTKTAPAPGTSLDRLRFAFASCQDWQSGFYSAYDNMAKEDLDLVVHLGDYRNRYALYRTDPSLQAIHAAFAWIVTWDDHEVDNNYADEIPEDNQSREAFLQRRANAYKAYYEHMPLRRESVPQGPDLRLYRRFTFGNLAEFNVLDTRQYRSDQPCGDGIKPPCPEAFAASQTMTGAEQEQWLLEGLSRSQARWNILAQQTMFAQYDFNPSPELKVFNLDQWDGYIAARDRILQFLSDRRPANPVVITGDIHSSWVHDLKRDFNNPQSETLGTEFVGTSISSDFPAAFILPVEAARRDNPHTKFFDGAFRGYVRCEVTPQQWRSDFRAVTTILAPESPIRTLASFVVEDGRPGAQPA
jgi:alkaline phosphatase D